MQFSRVDSKRKMRWAVPTGSCDIQCGLNITAKVSEQKIPKHSTRLNEREKLGLWC